jgi:hypothetical protein
MSVHPTNGNEGHHHVMHSGRNTLPTAQRSRKENESVPCTDDDFVPFTNTAVGLIPEVAWTDPGKRALLRDLGIITQRIVLTGADPKGEWVRVDAVSKLPESVAKARLSSLNLDQQNRRIVDEEIARIKAQGSQNGSSPPATSQKVAT